MMTWMIGDELENLSSFFESLADWLGNVVNYNTLALLVSLLALLVAIWSAWMSRKNLGHVESQTKSALDANRLAHEALERADLSIVSSLEDRVHADSPEVVIAVPDVSSVPVVNHYENPYPSPHPEPDYKSQPSQLDPIDDWFFEVYYLIRGSVLNAGSSPVLIQSMEVDFVEGESVFSTGNVKKPLLVDRAYGKYFLGPGQEVLFEWRVGGLVDFWLSVEREAIGKHALGGQFAFFPLNANPAVYYIDFQLDAYPFARTRGKFIDPRVIPESNSIVLDISNMEVANMQDIEDLKKRWDRQSGGRH